MDNVIKPIIRWIGGKRRFANLFKKYIPTNLNGNTYWEPFFGAGSLFFLTQPHTAVVSDLNSQLIQFYITIRDNPLLLYKYISQLKSNKRNYYKIRKLYNSSRPSVKQSARFLFLNKTCFNGIFRVNKKGDFNVPYGKIKNPSLPSKPELLAISKLLKKVKISSNSYKDISKYVKTGDFIYLDPPYPPVNGGSSFTHYTIEGFGLKQHKELANFANELDKKGCLVMISNADIPKIRRFYKGWNKKKLSVTRIVSCKAKRHKVNELIITNY